MRFSKAVGSNLTLKEGKLIIEAVFPYSIQPKSASFLTLCGLVDDVRTLYINRDPKLLRLIGEVQKVEKMVSADLKKAA